jgi:hypothetical protein
VQALRHITELIAAQLGTEMVVPRIIEAGLCLFASSSLSLFYSLSLSLSLSVSICLFLSSIFLIALSLLCCSSLFFLSVQVGAM